MSNAAEVGHEPDQTLPRLLHGERAAKAPPAPDDATFHLRHATRGFVVGLVVIVPAVIWHSERFGRVAQPPARMPAVVIAPVSVKPVDVPATPSAPLPPVAAPSVVTAQGAVPANLAVPAAGAASTQPPASEAPNGDRGRGEPLLAPVVAGAGTIGSPDRTARPKAAEPAEDISGRLEAARSLVADGDVLGARAVLAESALASVPEAAYVIAETYDPNVLAALGLSEVRAEVELARLFYERALAGGITAARQRLEGLR